MRHAVLARLMLTARVFRPVGFVEQLLIGAGIALFAHEVARALPAEDRVARNPPRRAFEVDLTLEEIQVQRAVIEPPLAALAVGEDLSEDFAGSLDAEEVLLVGRLLVRVGRRD